MFTDKHAIPTSVSAALYEGRRMSNVRLSGCVAAGTAGYIEKDVQ